MRFASSTATDQPRRAISRATVRPARPPPMTQTSISRSKPSRARGALVTRVASYQFCGGASGLSHCVRHLGCGHLALKRTLPVSKWTSTCAASCYSATPRPNRPRQVKATENARSPSAAARTPGGSAAIWRATPHSRRASWSPLPCAPRRRGNMRRPHSARSRRRRPSSGFTTPRRTRSSQCQGDAERPRSSCSSATIPDCTNWR